MVDSLRVSIERRSHDFSEISLSYEINLAGLLNVW